MAVAANVEVVHPKVLVDLDITAHLTERVDLTVGANNLLDNYPDILKPSNRGSRAFALSNQYAPYGFSGGFYSMKVTAHF